MSNFWRGVTTSSAVGREGVGDGRAIAARSGGLYLKLAGHQRAAIVLSLAALALATVPPPFGVASAATYTEEVLTIDGGAFVREDIFLPSDGTPWHLDFDVQSGGPIDVYVLHTADALTAYPSNPFTPIEFRENATSGVITFYPGNRLDAYSLVVDNADNARPTDVAPHGAVTVRILRSSPIRSNPQAEAALATGTGICAALLAVGTVGLAIYLKRRPPTASDEALAERVPRLEVDVAVPSRPRGAWAAPLEDEADEGRPAENTKGGAP